jgi:ABC-2 type transport system ATP-binding protein
VVRDLASDGAAVVYTTHYLPELELLDSTLAVADHGRLIARGDRATLLHVLPGHAVLEFADGSLDDAHLPTIAGELHMRGRELTLTADNVASVVGDLLASHPDLARGLRSVDVRPPSLDDLYHHLVVGDARS